MAARRCRDNIRASLRSSARWYQLRRSRTWRLLRVRMQRSLPPKIGARQRPHNDRSISGFSLPEMVYRSPQEPDPGRFCHMRKQTIVALIVAILACVTTASSRAEEQWPTRPLTMVVPFAAGGPVDLLGRILGQYLSVELKQPIVIENVPGAGGTPGSQRVARANPDGYTFLLGSIGTHALNQTLYRHPLYNAETDFTPVALIAQVPLVLIVRKDFPASDLAEFIAYTKAHQAQLQFGSAGAGTSTHIGCVLLDQVIGVNVVH